jgi:hypothetical protein
MRCTTHGTQGPTHKHYVARGGGGEGGGSARDPGALDVYGNFDSARWLGGRVERECVRGFVDNQEVTEGR